MKSAVDIIRGLMCLENPDKSGERCWNCDYDCRDPRSCRGQILRDAQNYLDLADGTVSRAKKEKNHGKH